MGPADPFVAVDELHGRRAPGEDCRPSPPPVVDDLHQRAAGRPSRSEVVLFVKQGGHPPHFIGLRRPDFQLAENHRIGFATAPPLQLSVRLIGFHPKPSRTQMEQFV